jgi:hypothetical protein
VGVRVGVVVVAVVVAVVGCSSGDSSPTELPAGSSAPQSSSPPSNPPSTAVTTPPPAAAPTLPATARADTPTAAESFARYYIEVLDYASHTGDVGLLRQLGACGTCRAQADGIEMFFKTGGHVEGGEIRINGTEVVRFVRSAALINVTYDQSAGKSIGRDGAIETSSAQRAETFALTLQYSKGSWTVQKMQVVE